MIEGPCPLCSKKHNQALHDGVCYYHFRQVSKAHKSLAPVKSKSEGQTVRERAYVKIAAAYKATHPICEAQLAGCWKETTDVHHRAGRQGDKLTDAALFLAVCRHCHTLIHDNDSYSKALGLSVLRLAKIETE